MWVIQAIHEDYTEPRYWGPHYSIPMCLQVHTCDAFLFDTKEQAERFLKDQMETDTTGNLFRWTSEPVEILETDENEMHFDPLMDID